MIVKKTHFRKGVCMMAVGLMNLCGCGFVAAQNLGSAGDAKSALYTQAGTDPTFQSLLDGNRLPTGHNSTEGVKGSKIHVNKAVVEKGANSHNAIPSNIKIHTLCNSAIPRRDFPKWTRWYQEDGHTQVFRLFQGEKNVRNERKLAARVEAFSDLNWKQGDWHEWSGTYTIVKPHSCAIFQAKNTKNAWGVMIGMSDNGDIRVGHRRHKDQDKIIAQNMTGKSFDLTVRDNGRDYEVYLNGQKVGTGSYDRPEGETSFRWGMYLGEHEVTHDAMIFVTGVKFK